MMSTNNVKRTTTHLEKANAINLFPTTLKIVLRAKRTKSSVNMIDYDK